MKFGSRQYSTNWGLQPRAAIRHEAETVPKKTLARECQESVNDREGGSGRVLGCHPRIATKHVGKYRWDLKGFPNAARQ
jgi:hypothetical protein